MNRLVKISILVFALILLVFPGIRVYGDQVLEEEVKVVHIEVPVRVHYDGEPVGRLTKEDFTLFENGEEQKILGFNEYRKSLEASEVKLSDQVSAAVLKPRLFVLVFNMTDLNLDIEKGMDKLFSSVLKQNDRLMVLVNEAFVPEHTITNLEWEKTELLKLLRKQSLLSLQKNQKVLNDLEVQVKKFKDLVLGKVRTLETGRDIRIMRTMLERMLKTMVNYKKTFLYPNIDRFYNFARYLETRNLEKWVLNFYQFERFPRLRLDSRVGLAINQMIGALLGDTSDEASYNASVGRMLMKLLQRFQREMEVGGDFPVKEVSRLFYQVNATYHTFFMRSLNRHLSEDLDYKNVATDLEHSLREITHITGGEVMTSNKLEQSLETIYKWEDIYYVLTYSPDDRGPKKKKLLIQVNKEGHKAHYDNTVFPDFFNEFVGKKNQENPDIKIEHLSFKGRVLAFVIRDFKILAQGKEKIGKAEIWVKVMDSKNRVVFDQKKGLELKKKINKISIRFKTLVEGEYNVIVELKDLLSGKTNMEYKRVVI